MTPYRDRVVIITGGGSGIGFALAEACSDRGAIVVVAGRTRERVHSAAESLKARGRRARATTIDVTRFEEVEGLVAETAAEFGRVDYLFNNAGSGLLAEARDMTIEDWRQVIDVNLLGVVHGVQAAYPRMVAQGRGHIVNIASLAGLVPMPGAVAYVAAKHGVVGLSHALRVEAARHGVRVSVACPASVDTPLTTSVPCKNFDRDAVREAIPSRAMSAAQCAELILKGVARNRATIVPGPAAAIWLMHRYAPFLTTKLAASFGKTLSKLHLPTTKGTIGQN